MRPLAPQVTQGPRADLLALVANTPGIHLRLLERESGLPLGQVLYHLERLERMGLIVSARDAGFRRYFLTREVGRGEKRYFAALRHEVPRRVLLRLLDRSPLAHKQIQEPLGVAASTLSFHLQRLLASGVLLRVRTGTANHYAIAEPEIVRRELVFYRESFRDPEVDRYVRSLLTQLPPLAPPPARGIVVEGTGAAPVAS
jgi:predicted transcriptional regulator